MSNPSLAIDFGTTRTKVAYIDPKEGKPAIAEIGREIRSVVPSIFYLPVGTASPILVGDDAQDMVDTDPAGVVIKLKMEIHSEGPKIIGRDRPRINRPELAGRLFRWIREQCSEQVLYADVRTCTITVPVSFEDRQRQCIKQAAEWGGFREIRLEEEPVAAATAWLNDVGERITDMVMVCDIGGGTTDLALLEFAGKRIQAVADVPTRGFNNLGGCQVDEAIWNRILQFVNSNETGIEEKASKYLLRIRRLKETIRQFASDKLPFGRKSVIPKRVVEGAIRKIVEDIVVAVRGFHDSARKIIGNRTIPLLLVGGGAGLQGLRESLEPAVSGQVYLWNRSDYATAIGAALLQQQSRRTVAPGTLKLGSESSQIANERKTSENKQSSHAAEVTASATATSATVRCLDCGSPVRPIPTSDGCFSLHCDLCGALRNVDRNVVQEAIQQTLSNGKGQESADTRGNKSRNSEHQEISAHPQASATEFDVRTLVADGDGVNALAKATEIFERRPSIESFELWCECLLVVSDYARELTVSRSKHAGNGQDFWPTIRVATVLSHLGRFDEVDSLLARTPESRDPDEFPRRYLKFRGRRSAFLFEGNLETLNSLLSLRKKHPELLAIQAIHVYERESVDKGLKLVRKAIGCHPHNLHTLQAAAILVSRSNSQAIGISPDEILHRMKRVGPTSIQTLFSQSLRLAENGDTEAACAGFEHLSHDQRLRGDRMLRSTLLSCIAHLRDAPGKETLQRAAIADWNAAEPDHPDAMTAQARLLVVSGQFSNAVPMLDRCISLVDKPTEALQLRSLCHVHGRRPPSALQDAAQAFEYDRNNRQTRFILTTSIVYKWLQEPSNPSAVVGNNRLFGWPTMPPDKLQGARTEYLGAYVDENSSLVLLYDNTFFGGAGHGFAVLDNCLVVHNYSASQKYSLLFSSTPKWKVRRNLFGDKLIIKSAKQEFVIHIDSSIPNVIWDSVSKMLEELSQAYSET